MNDQVTSIPNVQMQLIVTQEFHNTKWWLVRRSIKGSSLSGEGLRWTDPRR